MAERMVAGFTDPAFSRADPVHSLLDIVMTLSTSTSTDGVGPPRSDRPWETQVEVVGTVKPGRRVAAS